ncbi:hypothetical protein [Litchfieldia salsa]|uniref:Uncharacterized protein n=1 Tax=Litchfieldia salsa TaxID=930152 RepID=A0A1H0X0E5_9BACI|nr:hypothetical protein [Litchfieldia salsa]SDP96319.1 hypothetical protein SAMN05216565_12120 [Litchfieldia salsa]
MNNKEEFKNALDEEVFKENPYNAVIKERAIRKITQVEKQLTTSNRRQLIFNRVVTVCVCFSFLIVTIYLLNLKIVEDGIENNQATNDIKTPEKESDLVKEMLTNIEALQEYRRLPDGIKNKFNENLLYSYNNDADFREKIAIAQETTDSLSIYKLEALTEKLPINDYFGEFNDHKDTIYIVGKEWKEIENAFLDLEYDQQVLLSHLLNEIGRNYVLNTGDFSVAEGTEFFKPLLAWDKVDSSVKQNIINDIDNKIRILKDALEKSSENDHLIYNNLLKFLDSYQSMKDLRNQQELDNYFGISRDFFIFSFIIIKPRPVEVLEEPHYISNGEHVKIVLEEYPR